MTILNDHVPSSQELYYLSEYIEPTFICSFLSLSIFLNVSYGADLNVQSVLQF